MSKRQQQARARAREILAAQRRAQERRRRLTIAGSAVGLVVLIVAIFAVVKLTSSPSAPAQASSAVSATVLARVTGVPAAALDRVGRGSGMIAQPTKLSGRPVLQADGKPLVLYMGAEYCPYCAAQRWPLVMALSRFGTFTGLGQTASSSTDVDPNTPTLSFHGATYTSQYLSFQGVEMYSNQPTSDGRYTTLDNPTAAQTKLLQQDGKNAFPFVDFGDQAEVTAVTIDPAMLAGMTHEQVADALGNPDTAIGKAFGGSANAFTAILCNLTGGQPGAVCTRPAAKAYQGDSGGAQ